MQTVIYTKKNTDLAPYLDHCPPLMLTTVVKDITDMKDKLSGIWKPPGFGRILAQIMSKT